MMARPVVALLTDFGLQDHYVGTMKGVVLSVCSDAALVDITHHIPPQDVAWGALELAAAYEYFPGGTVFVAVVDPGVGSSRRGIAAEAGGYYFVAPDNGVLTQVFAQTPPTLVVDLQERKFARHTISRTFEGRDRFAPAAGWLARGAALAVLGPAISDWVTIQLRQPRHTGDGLVGEVMRVDRFGNLITNITRERSSRLNLIAARVEVADASVPIVGTYAEAPAGELCALFGSSGYLEVALNGGSAAERLGVGRGGVVAVRALP
jgi:S-adenosyl-L-methionine hydrolase (adenosine-forming)